MKYLLLNPPKDNVLSCILSFLKVRFTEKYANRLFNEHPHKYNMFGLSQMLADYGVKSAGLNIPDKEQSIYQLDLPFIAHTEKDFVVVTNINQDKVTYYLKGVKYRIPIPEFVNFWTGFTLLVEADKNSIEPEYAKNIKQQSISSLGKVLLWIAGIIVLILSIIQKSLYTNIGLILLFLLNISGGYVCYLLLLKQMKIKSNTADKICYAFSRRNCNDILDSSAAKLWGVISWSELGFSYFFSNLYILLFMPALLPFLFLLNIGALPYSFWSIWYQKYRAGQWCPLCLIVQLLFWCIFITNLIFGFVSMPHFSFLNILYVGLIYAIPFLIINLLMPQFAGAKKGETIIQEFNAFKMDSNIFLALLKKQPKYESAVNYSSTLFGNPDAKIRITVFTNPHCQPCAQMHERIDKFLFKTGDKFCIQYILTAFNKELQESNRFLLAINKYKNDEERNRIFSEWFADGKYDRKAFFEKYPVDVSTIEEEWIKHEEWREKTNLSGTPTLIVQNHRLPEEYRLEDLIYFDNINVD